MRQDFRNHGSIEQHARLVTNYEGFFIRRDEQTSTCYVASDLILNASDFSRAKDWRTSRIEVIRIPKPITAVDDDEQVTSSITRDGPYSYASTAA